MSLNVRSGEGQLPTFVNILARKALALAAISANVTTHTSINVAVLNFPGVALAKLNATAQNHLVVEVLNSPELTLGALIADPNFATRVFATRPNLALGGNGFVHSISATNTPNQAPVWSGLPSTFTAIQGTAATFSVASYVSDPEGSAVGITHTSGAFPAGWSYNSTLKQYIYDGVGAVGGTNGHILTADDAADDWLTRSAGATFSDRLDTITNLNAWVLANGRQDHCTLDTAIKVLGAAGSFRIESRDGDGPDSGDIGIPIGGPYGNGTTLWQSYRCRADAANAYAPWIVGSPSGAKISICSHSSSSNQVNESVIQSTNQAGIITAYHQDGSNFPSYEVALGGSDFRDQPAIDNSTLSPPVANYPLTGNNPDTGVPWTAAEQQVRRYSILYSRRSTPGAEAFQKGFGDPLTGAFRQYPNTFITITTRQIIGTFGSANSSFTLWAALDGQPYVKLIDATGVQFGAGPDYNRLWLLQYVTNRSSGGRRVSSIASGISGVSAIVAAKGTPLGAGSLEYTASTGRFRFKSAVDNYGAAHAFSAANGISIINLASSASGTSTTSAGSVTLPQASIAVTDASSFPSSGTVVFGYPNTTTGGVGEQLVQYTSKSGNTLLGCTGGTGTHIAGSPVAVSSFITLQLDNSALLPSSGVTQAAVTVIDGRGTSAIYYNDVIVKTGSTGINAPGGFVPT